jgi:aspartate carbamoyltransferase catalytic subunit
MDFKGKDIISMGEFTRRDIEKIFETAEKLEKLEKSDQYGHTLLKNKNVAILFYQPSTRTRLGFEAATLKLGGNTFGFADPKVTRGGDYYKETLLDMIRVVDQLADVIVMRHPEENAAEIAAEYADAPIINAGDGNNHHPTQALQDLYTMYKEYNGLDGLTIGLVGDFKIRSFRSIIQGLTKFNLKKLLLVPAPGEGITDDVFQRLREASFEWEIRSSINDIISEIDVLELNGINHPYRNIECVTPDTHKVTLQTLKAAKKNLSILHTMPRKDELPMEIDYTPYAKYFKQVKYGLYIKMALLTLVLGEEKTLEQKERLITLFN